MNDLTFTKGQLAGLIVLRVCIGWHFLYEGFVKLANPYWSSAEYLQESQGFLSSLFQTLSENPTVLDIIDQLNIWGLVLIGTALIAGCMMRAACIAGMVLLLLYYISNPPFIGMVTTLPMEGNYLFVNKNLIEIAALFVLYLFPTSHRLGLDKIIWWNKKQDSIHEQ